MLSSCHLRSRRGRDGTSSLLSGAGAKTLSMLGLDNSKMYRASITQGVGVAASGATTAEEFADQHRSAIH